ncbi:MAG: hypothetical protein IPO07_06180 [Haliscomenobacter sp.]|nr:hypothetical protein [Haliscomenobacter sp.]MBK9488404.1 hypothetical protein [Haliscomenobacter sp.]
MKKQTGIWLDLRNAWIINLPTEENAAVEIQHISSEIEEGGLGGGTLSKAHWSNRAGENQKRMEERRHHQEEDYFHTILSLLEPATDDLVIFGPPRLNMASKTL